jgi:hypothetical protein
LELLTIKIGSFQIKKLNNFQEISYYHLHESEHNMHQFELNPDHTHFILVDDDGVHSKLLEFRVALEKRLQKPIFQRKSKRANADAAAASVQRLQSSELNVYSPYDAIPIVCLLIGGGVGSISLVQTKLMQGIPVLVFKGSGHAPDLISGIYEDFSDRFSE